MSFYADLHIHSRFSRATSRDLDLPTLARWARRKGITVLGTGDFTHPAWMEEIREQLVPAEPGLFKLRDDLDREASGDAGAAGAAPVRFMLQVEISTIYKRGEKTRKVHHLLYAPDIDSAERIRQRLGAIGNIASDGRPILGLDSRDLLEITLEAGEGCYLVPAHIWTPWFSALGSKSGFDSIDACYGDLAEHIFAVETGLSSDPPMNRLLSALDRFTLVSSSDAHSPGKLGREATAFDADLDYFAIKRALETGDGVRTVEFFAEQGKYHAGGHRKCGVRLDSQAAREADGRCPACGKPFTEGVLDRVHQLADRSTGDAKEAALGGFDSFIPLPEILSEISGVGPNTKTVARLYDRLVGEVAPEMEILGAVPGEEIEAAGFPELAEGIGRMRAGRVIRDPGYDGVYGKVKLFDEGELPGR